LIGYEKDEGAPVEDAVKAVERMLQTAWRRRWSCGGEEPVIIPREWSRIVVYSEGVYERMVPCTQLYQCVVLHFLNLHYSRTSICIETISATRYLNSTWEGLGFNWGADASKRPFGSSDMAKGWIGFRVISLPGV